LRYLTLEQDDVTGTFRLYNGRGLDIMALNVEEALREALDQMMIPIDIRSLFDASETLHELMGSD
jgi:hypothetical protein